MARKALRRVICFLSGSRIHPTFANGSFRASDHTFDPDGYFRRKKSGRVVGVWYAEIGPDNTTNKHVIRGTRLADVCGLEALRWRILCMIHHKLLPELTAAFRAGRELGRICWRGRDNRWECLEYEDGDGARSTYINDSERGLSAIDRLANLPRQDQIEAGSRYHEADMRFHRYTRARAIVDAALWTALQLSGRLPPVAVNRRDTQDVVVNARINNRIYTLRADSYQVRHGVVHWPEPGEINLEFRPTAKKSARGAETSVQV
jgi:hypothetical protein